MIEDYLITIAEAIKLKNGDCAIIGSAQGLSDADLPRLKLKNKLVKVKTKAAEVYSFEIIDINISRSISGQLLVGFSVKETEDFYKIHSGDEVYRFI